MSVFHALTQLVGHCLVVIEGPLWLIFLATLAPTTLRAVRRIGKWGQGSALAAVLGLPVALRTPLPGEPIFWPYPLMKADVGAPLYTRQSSSLPLLLRFLVFDLHGGFDA